MTLLACIYCGSCVSGKHAGGAVVPGRLGALQVQAATERTASELAIQRLQAEINDLRRRWHAAIANHRSLELSKGAAKDRWYQEREAEWAAQSMGLRRAMNASVAFGSLGLLAMCLGGFGEPSLAMTLISGLAFLSFLVVLDKGPSKVPTQLQLAEWSPAGPLDDSEFRTRFERLARDVERHQNVLDGHQDVGRNVSSSRAVIPGRLERRRTDEPLQVSSCA